MFFFLQASHKRQAEIPMQERVGLVTSQAQMLSTCAMISKKSTIMTQYITDSTDICKSIMNQLISTH